MYKCVCVCAHVHTSCVDACESESDREREEEALKKRSLTTKLFKKRRLALIFISK